MIVKLDELKRGTRVGKGGQGTIYETDRSFFGWPTPLVLKIYDHYLAAPALAAFDRRTDWAMGLGAAAREELYRAACWPLVAVEDRGMLAGIVMPDERPRHGVRMALPSGLSNDVLMCLEHLLTEDDYIERRFKLASDTRVRATIAERMAGSLAVLHRHAIVVSDFSHRNVLVRVSEPYAVTLIDCDSMRFQGESSLKPVETPDWEIPEEWNEPPLTRAADSYKLGLAVLRLFARKQGVRHLGEAQPHVPTALRPLLTSALGRDPGLRPAAGRWQGSLRDVLGTQLNRDFPGPPSKVTSREPSISAGAVGSARLSQGVGTGPGVVAQSVIPIPATTLAVTAGPTGGGGPGRLGSQFISTAGSKSNQPPVASRVVGTTPAPGGGARTRLGVGPAIAVLVIVCTAIVVLAAIGSSGSSRAPAPLAAQQRLAARTIAAHHLIPVAGAGEAGWILSKGGHLWTWNYPESRLVPVTELPQSSLYASVHWRGLYAHRHDSGSHSSRARASGPPARASSGRPRRVGSGSSSLASSTAPSQSSRSQPASSSTLTVHSRPVPPPSTGGSTGLEGKTESPPPSPHGGQGGGGLEGKAETESHSHPGGGLSGAGE